MKVCTYCLREGHRASNCPLRKRVYEMPMMIEGSLVSRPEYRVGLDGRPVLILLVRTGAALPVELRLEGTNLPESHEVAREWARVIQVGETVTGHCDGVTRERVDHGARAAITSNVSRVDLAGLNVFSNGRFVSF